MESALKPVLWVGSALKDLKAFPEEARSEVGFALFQAQRGEKPLNTKPLKGYSDLAPKKWTFPISRERRRMFR